MLCLRVVDERQLLPLHVERNTVSKLLTHLTQRVTLPDFSIGLPAVSHERVVHVVTENNAPHDFVSVLTGLKPLVPCLVTAHCRNTASVTVREVTLNH